jgi:hypothetical protein
VKNLDVTLVHTLSVNNTGRMNFKENLEKNFDESASPLLNLGALIPLKCLKVP